MNGYPKGGDGGRRKFRYPEDHEHEFDHDEMTQNSSLPYRSSLGPEMTDDDNPLIIPNGYPHTADSPPFITDEGEEMLKYTIYDQQPDGIRNVIGTLTTVRGKSSLIIPFTETKRRITSTRSLFRYKGIQVTSIVYFRVEFLGALC